MIKEIIVTFHTTDVAIYFESLCKKNTINGRLIPVPRFLSAGCGFAWSSEIAEKEKLDDLIKKFNIDYEQMIEN